MMSDILILGLASQNCRWNGVKSGSCMRTRTRAPPTKRSRMSGGGGERNLFDISHWIPYLRTPPETFFSLSFTHANVEYTRSLPHSHTHSLTRFFSPPSPCSVRGATEYDSMEQNHGQRHIVHRSYQEALIEQEPI